MPGSGSIIREARLRAGLTQAELSRRSGKDRAQIARWERDGVVPSFEALLEVVRACGFDISLDLVALVEPAADSIGETRDLTPAQRLDRMLLRRGEPQAGAVGS